MTSPHRVRPRYGRMASLASSITVTAIALLGGLGGLPSSADTPGGSSAGTTTVGATAGLSAVTTTPVAELDAPVAGTPAPDSAERRLEPARDTALPQGSGDGRRVVFSESRQRVWLVDADGGVRRTYPVSGSIYDNLEPGTFAVYSRSEQAWGIDDSGTMKYFVRFARGDRAAIGFHDIPIADGHLVQRLDQLGTPLSHGCIRQHRPDAVALWRFAPLGTTVVVTA